MGILYGQGEKRGGEVLSDIWIDKMYYKGSPMNCESAALCAGEYQLWGAVFDWYANGPIHVIVTASTWEMKLAYIILGVVFVWKLADGLKVTQILKRISQRKNVIELRGKNNIALVPSSSSAQK